MIEVRGLSKVYADGKQALEGLDLDLGPGMFGLLGPNGAGKTTFISMLVLAVEPTRGSLRYHGLDPSSGRSRSRIRSIIGYLPQDFAPVPSLTGLEYLTWCARLRGVGLSRKSLRRRCGQLLDAVGLADAAGRFAGEYSGGMKRRLGIAQALVHGPELVVVDEPTAGLDPEERIRFRSLITEVAGTTTVLLSTHIVEDIEATCSELGIIGSGRLLFTGSPSSLMREFEGRIWAVSDSREPDPGERTVARRSDPAGGALRLIQAESGPEGSAPVVPTLEEAYCAFLDTHGLSPEGETE